jgi:hypothetical protein
MVKTRITMDMHGLVGLLLVLKTRLEDGDIEGAIGQIDRMIAEFEGWYEE